MMFSSVLYGKYSTALSDASLTSHSKAICQFWAKINLRKIKMKHAKVVGGENSNFNGVITKGSSWQWNWKDDGRRIQFLKNLVKP